MTILVTGATGTVGRQVVDHLLQAGAQVRALTRRPERAELPEGVEFVAGDLTVPETLAPAFSGVTGVHLINFGGDDYAPLATGPQIVALARRAGVRKVTMLSGWDESTVEAAVRGSDLEWTYLQPTEFMANALDWAESIRTTGTVEQPLGDTRTAMVHEADIGAVAAAVLTSEGHAGQTYGLTGPELLSLRDQVRIIGEAAGREVRFIELTEEQAREKWLAEGTPKEMVDFHFEVFDVPDGTYTTTPTVAQVTGRPARTFAQWAAEHADAATAYTQALDLAHTGDRYLEVEARIGQAALNHDLGQHHQARQDTSTALTTAHQLGYGLLVARAQATQAETGNRLVL